MFFRYTVPKAGTRFNFNICVVVVTVYFVAVIIIIIKFPYNVRSD